MITWPKEEGAPVHPYEFSYRSEAFDKRQYLVWREWMESKGYEIPEMYRIKQYEK